MSDSPVKTHFDTPADEENNVNSTKLDRRASVLLTDEQFEKLYFTPGGQKAKGDFAQRLGNPTAFSIASFTIPLMPFSIALMGWGGVTQSMLVPLVGAFYLVGGLGMMLGGLLDWILGNTYPATVFMCFAGFYLSFAFVLQPSQLIASTLATDTLDYQRSIAFYLISWAIVLTIFGLCAIRTNLAFLSLFGAIIPAVCVLSSAYFMDYHHPAEAAKLFKAAGSLMFVTALSGWYNLAASMFHITDFPVKLPVGDMSSFMR